MRVSLVANISLNYCVDVNLPSADRSILCKITFLKDHGNLSKNCNLSVQNINSSSGKGSCTGYCVLF